MKKLILAGILAMQTCAPAYAQMEGPSMRRAALPVFCTDDAQVERVLSEYGESPIFVGLSGSGLKAYLAFNPQTETWSFIFNHPDGSPCVIVTGGAGLVIEPTEPKAPTTDG